MINPRSNHGSSRKGLRLIGGLTLLLVAIGLLVVARRALLIFFPSQEPPRISARAISDAGFREQRTLTLIHILPAGLFMTLMPLQFVSRIRTRHLGWHRWSGRLLIILGAIVGVSALIMGYKMPIGGANETAATTVYATLFLFFLGLGFWNVRRRRIAEHREWMIRAFGVALGIATTRPIVGAFFAAGRLSPQEFFGIAFWLGFTVTLLAAEGWIHYSQAHITAQAKKA